MIHIRSLNKFFNKGRQNEIHVINNIDLELPEKGMVAVFGKSGCGKTTLLNVIGGLDSFESGELTVGGENIRRNPDELRNRMMGYIFQNYNLNKGENCYENIADALRLCGMTDAEEIETRVMAALANVGMENYHSRMPDALSGGQQQRIAIARAIVKNPRIILADEPTGNLDEANTVLIMDLLKEISRDHLVLLVTHEANLVDYYCDRVIELQDGCVKNIRDNTGANGYTSRDKNDIFLGELEHSTASTGNAEIEYFGDKPEQPVKLRIVNNGGKLYVQIQTPHVQVLDEGSEVRLREGVFQHEQRAREQSESIDMSALPPVQGTRFGRLFTFFSSVKSGYNANFHKQKKGRKLLKRCMGLFAAVLVIVSSLFGTAIDKLITADQGYNHNMFYVYTPADSKVSARLNQALASGEAGIDQIYLMNAYPSGDGQVAFRTGSFETFSSSSLFGDDDSLSANAAILSHRLAEGLNPVAGQNENLQPQDIVITTAVADKLLDKSTVGYIKEYKNLIGLILSSSNFSDNMYSGKPLSVDGQSLRICAVVRSSENAVYVSDRALTQSIRNQFSSSLRVAPASEFGKTVAEGETLLYVSESFANSKFPSVGSQVLVQGQTLKLTATEYFADSYDSWCELNGHKRTELKEWMYAMEGTTGDNIDDVTSAYYYQYWLDYYYAYMDEFLTEYALHNPYDMTAWLWKYKGVDEVRFIFMENFDELYAAANYKETHGSYPDRDDVMLSAGDIYSQLDFWLDSYRSEYYSYQDTITVSQFADSWLYLLNDADYARLTTVYGSSDASVSGNYTDYKEPVYDGTEDVEIYTAMSVSTADGWYEDVYYEGGPKDYVYTAIHTTDPAATEKLLLNEFSDLDTGMESRQAIRTPGKIHDAVIGDQWGSILRNLVVMAVLFGLMSVCMYFIMRSSLMSRVKEIGIYRAIGVSRRNLVFRFFVESLVLTTLSVFVGFLISAVVMNLWLGLSPLLANLFFFPAWYALILLALIYAVCLFCGTVPILLLLTKTPSQILAKYDI